tara:strand:- start:336 stop:551 length:216 start_codon:yes stop_codon:yes gene_type:complete
MVTLLADSTVVMEVSKETTGADVSVIGGGGDDPSSLEPPQLVIIKAPSDAQRQNFRLDFIVTVQTSSINAT